MKTSHKVAIASVCVGAGAVAILTACSPSDGTTDSSGPRTTPPRAVVRLATAQSWWDITKPDYDAITQDVGNVADDSTNDPEAVVNDCSKMQLDIQLFEADPQAPDAVLRADLAQAMTQLKSGADACVAGSTDSAAAFFVQANNYFVVAYQRTQELLDAK